MNKKELLTKFKNSEYLSGIDYEYIINDLDGEDTENLKEKFEEAIYHEEIIYYNRAIEFLSENDYSLQNSLELAQELGYQPADLNSEILATLLLQNYMQEELNEILN